MFTSGGIGDDDIEFAVTSVIDGMVFNEPTGVITFSRSWEERDYFARFTGRGINKYYGTRDTLKQLLHTYKKHELIDLIVDFVANAKDEDWEDYEGD